jgi:hypothetical protein
MRLLLLLLLLVMVLLLLVLLFVLVLLLLLRIRTPGCADDRALKGSCVHALACDVGATPRRKHCESELGKPPHPHLWAGETSVGQLPPHHARKRASASNTCDV